MDERLLFPATERNRGAIGDVLSKILPSSGFVLEIASGSGEHGVIFQERFPNIHWQTSDPDPSYRRSISAWIRHQGLIKQMAEPLDLDVQKKPWPLSPEIRLSLQAIVCINMLHIAAWSCTEALFEEASTFLKKDQLLIVYGLFIRDGKHTSRSNEEFDYSLKTRNSFWGIPDLDSVSEIASKNGLDKHNVFEMPANNLTVIFKMK